MKLPPQIRFIQRGWFNSNNILILGDDGPVIIDTGHEADAATTLHLIAAEGIDPHEISLIVNTHCHWDHFGGNRALKVISDAPLATGKQTAAIFAANDREAMWLDYFGVNFVPETADLTWQDGDMVELSGLPFEVIAAPGHAPDTILFYQPDHKLLISADALHEQDCGVLNVVVHGFGVVDSALTTVDRLLTYDIELALPGHGPIITDVVGSLAALKKRLAGFKHDPRRLAYHLARRVTMAALLESQPIERQNFISMVSELPWTRDYAPLCGYDDREQFVIDRLAEFQIRGLLRTIENMLVSNVQR